MYAIIETGGKQLKVEKGQKVLVEKLGAEPGSTVTFDKVLLVGGDDVKVGDPYVQGATVTGKVLENGRGEKITVFKFKRRKNYRRKQGHRQAYTKVAIESIQA